MELTKKELLAILEQHERSWKAQLASDEMALRIHKKIGSDSKVLETIAASVVKAENALAALAEERKTIETMPDD